MMCVIVIESAADGVDPQWNSNAPACRSTRSGDLVAPPHSQASIAVSINDSNWTAPNASPDLRQQIGQKLSLQPSGGLRTVPIAAVVLTGGAIAGMLTLHKCQPFTLLATPHVHAVLDANPVFEFLNRIIVSRPTLRAA